MPEKPSIDLNNTSNRVMVGIILALVFLGGWWLIARHAALRIAAFEAKQAETQESGLVADAGQADIGSVLGPLSDDTPKITASTESIDVLDQDPGLSVIVKGVALVQVSWIAVRDSSGRTLGAGRFEPGVHMGIEVPLLRATEAGQSYQALIYVDDGDREFDLHKDILVTYADGSVAGDVFSVQ
jgi:hypothetical protein